MANHGSALLRKQKSRTLDANLKRRARNLQPTAESITEHGSLIRYGLRVKDQDLEQIVSRVEAGETTIA
jgi:hypothetical protein